MNCTAPQSSLTNLLSYKNAGGGKILPQETEVIAQVFLCFISGAFICPSESIAQKSCAIIKHFYQIIDCGDLKSSRSIRSRQLGLRANSLRLHIDVQRGGKTVNNVSCLIAGDV